MATTISPLSDVQGAASALERARQSLDTVGELSDEQIAEDADFLGYYASEITTEAEAILTWSDRVNRIAREVREAESAKRRDESPKGEERAKVLRDFVTAEAFTRIIQGIGGWASEPHEMPVDESLRALFDGVDLDRVGSLGQDQFNELWPNDEGDWTDDERAEHAQAVRDGHRLAATMLRTLAASADWLNAAAARQEQLATKGGDRA